MDRLLYGLTKTLLMILMIVAIVCFVLDRVLYRPDMVLPAMSLAGLGSLTMLLFRLQ
jgi:hypothetical protein